MKYLTIAMISAGLLLGVASTPSAFAQGKGGGGAQKAGAKGKKAGPRDGSGKQQGQGQKGKQTGPKDGSGPIHTPPKQ